MRRETFLKRQSEVRFGWQAVDLNFLGHFLTFPRENPLAVNYILETGSGQTAVTVET